MGAILTMKCPHCLSIQGLRIVAASASKTWRQRYAYLQCPECLKPACAGLRCTDQDSSPRETEVDPDGESVENLVFPGNGTPLRYGWEIEKTWPDPPKPNIPEHLPEAVHRAFAGAEMTFNVRGLEEQTAGSYGRALDLATKLIAENEPDRERYAGKKLNDRIGMLVKAKRLTTDLGEWAHHIKAVRNGAMHEIAEIDRDELAALRVFAEMVLRYLFTLPGMLAERRASTRAGLTEPPPNSQRDPANIA